MVDTKSDNRHWYDGLGSMFSGAAGAVGRGAKSAQASIAGSDGAQGFGKMSGLSPYMKMFGMTPSAGAPEDRAAKPSELRDLGALLASQGRDRQARGEFQRAIAMDPGDAAAWLNLGNLERRAGRNPRALDAYRTAEARDSNRADRWADAERSQIRIRERRLAQRLSEERGERP